MHYDYWKTTNIEEERYFAKITPYEDEAMKLDKQGRNYLYDGDFYTKEEIVELLKCYEEYNEEDEELIYDYHYDYDEILEYLLKDLEEF